MTETMYDETDLDDEDDDSGTTTESDVERALAAAFDSGELVLDLDDDVEVESAYGFADSGLLTRNAGVVLRLSDGTEFQVTIVESTRR